jgi:hypothetical protein
MKSAKLNPKVKTDYKFPADAGFVCNKAATTIAMLREKIKCTIYIIKLEAFLAILNSPLHPNEIM